MKDRFYVAIVNTIIYGGIGLLLIPHTPRFTLKLMKTRLAFSIAKGLLLGAALIAIASLVGCASTTFYMDGKRVARMEGDMTGVTFIRNPNGEFHFTAETVDHSSATLAAGKTSAGNIAAIGTATTTALLIK